MTATPEDAAGGRVPADRDVPDGLPDDGLRWSRDLPSEDLGGSSTDPRDSAPDIDPEAVPADEPVSADVRATSDAFFAGLHRESSPAARAQRAEEPAAEPMSADARAAADAFFAALRSGAQPTPPADEPEGSTAAMAVLLDEPPPVDRERDWAWVEEWRAGGEPTPWGPGIAFAAFVALVIGAAVYVLSSGLRDAPLWAFLSNIVAAAFLAPALWMARRLPVFRWISLGGFVGVIVAWLALLLFPASTF